jgi:ABC-2 type transport system permease protein
MRLITPPLGPLLWKELRQLRRSRAALLSATLLPLLLLVIMPLTQYAAFTADPEASLRDIGVTGPANQALFRHFQTPLDIYRHLLLPLFVSLSGLVAPTVAASYALVAERERRSLDLLMALPVSVGEIVTAKVLSVLLAGVLVVLPLFAVTSTVLLAQDAISLRLVGLLGFLLLAGLSCSVGVTTVITLLARDFRTANNLSGMQVGPLVLALLASLSLVPPPYGMLVAAFVLVAVGAAGLLIAWRWITFERYLA